MPSLNIPVEQVQVGDIIQGFKVVRIGTFGVSHAQRDEDSVCTPDPDAHREFIPRHKRVAKECAEERRTYKIGGAKYYNLCFSRTQQLGITLERGTLIEVFRKAS